MTSKQINIAIATCGGHEDVSPHPDPHTDHRLRFRRNGSWEWFDKYYDESLDAMAEAEKTLPPDERARYATLLQIVVAKAHHLNTDDADCVADFYVITASPQQRAEAFLRTKGLWQWPTTQTV